MPRLVPCLCFAALSLPTTALAAPGDKGSIPGPFEPGSGSYTVLAGSANGGFELQGPGGMIDAAQWTNSWPFIRILNQGMDGSAAMVMNDPERTFNGTGVAATSTVGYPVAAGTYIFSAFVRSGLEGNNPNARIDLDTLPWGCTVSADSCGNDEYEFIWCELENTTGGAVNVTVRVIVDGIVSATPGKVAEFDDVALTPINAFDFPVSLDADCDGVLDTMGTTGTTGTTTGTDSGTTDSGTTDSGTTDSGTTDSGTTGTGTTDSGTTVDTTGTTTGTSSAETGTTDGLTGTSGTAPTGDGGDQGETGDGGVGETAMGGSASSGGGNSEGGAQTGTPVSGGSSPFGSDDPSVGCACNHGPVGSTAWAAMLVALPLLGRRPRLH